MKLQPITIKAKDGSSKELHCKHKDIWPPAHSRLDSSPLELRQEGSIDEAKYQQLQTWEKVCGLLDMNKAKCPTCPLALVHSKGRWIPHAPGGKPTTAFPPFAKAKPGRNQR